MKSVRNCLYVIYFLLFISGKLSLRSDRILSLDRTLHLSENDWRDARSCRKARAKKKQDKRQTSETHKAAGNNFEGFYLGICST